MMWDVKNSMGTMKVGNTVVTLAKMGQGEGTTDSYTLIFKVNGKPYYMQWADSIFGIVYNKQYQDVEKRYMDYWILEIE